MRRGPAAEGAMAGETFGWSGVEGESLGRGGE